MSGYFERLGEELRLATEDRYRPKGMVRRLVYARVGRWPGLGVIAIVVLSGSAAAAAIPLFGGSHGLVGRVPEPALRSPGTLPGAAGARLPDRLPNGLRYAIPVTPDLEAGYAGWCSYPVFELAKSPGLSSPEGGACALATVGSVGIVAGGEPLTNVLESLPRPHASNATATLPASAAREQAVRDDVFLNWFVVSDRVAVIKLGGGSFVPRRDSELAPGWRGVAAFTRGLTTRVRFLDRRGRPINQDTAPPVPAVPVTTIDPHHVPAAVCALGSSTLAGVGTEWEVVANAAPARGPLVDPGVLFSCARAWYSFPRSHAVYSAAILLSARDPARHAPPLPGLTPSIRAGDYEEAASAAGATTARRIGNAWLLVQGPERRLRVALLHNLTALGTAIRR